MMEFLLFEYTHLILNTNKVVEFFFCVLGIDLNLHQNIYFKKSQKKLLHVDSLTWQRSLVQTMYKLISTLA